MAEADAYKATIEKLNDRVYGLQGIAFNYRKQISDLNIGLQEAERQLAEQKNKSIDVLPTVVFDKLEQEINDKDQKIKEKDEKIKEKDEKIRELSDQLKKPHEVRCVIVNIIIVVY